MSSSFPAPSMAVTTGTAHGRETDTVNSFPPPLPPPEQPTVPRTAQSGGDGSEWDWERFKELAEEWYRPVLRREGWVALAYVFVGAITASVLFGLFVAASAVTFGLCFALVGFLLIVPVLRLPAVFANVDRELAKWMGVSIERRPLRRVDGIGPGAIKAALTDVERWRLVGFLAVNSLLAPVLFSIASIPVGIAVQGVFGGGVLADVPVLFGLSTPVAVISGLFMIGAIPRLAIWIADLKVQSTRWFIGPDRLAAAERRVSSLSSQRQDILDAVAEERRRIERNLHDGVQQQLVAIGLDLGMATNHLDADSARARELIMQAREKVQGSIGELRQLGRGLHPAILEDRGIDAALSAVVAGSTIPISIHVDPELTLSTDVAETVYFIANEAIANVLKHANARVASVHVAKVGGNVRVTVHDDGRGGADFAGGTGLAGIRARVNAVDGVLTVTSPAHGPTTIVAEIPRQGGHA